MDLGKSLKDLRKKAGYKYQLHAAKAIGTDQAYLSQMENNDRFPTIQMLTRIAKTYNVPVSVIFINSLDEDDIQRGKKKEYKEMRPVFDKWLVDVLKK